MGQAISGRTTPEEACEALGIKKSPYYERLRFLGIKANKDEELSQLIEEAGDLKTQQIATPYLVKLHLVNNMTEEDLSDEQKAKLQTIRDAANPKPNVAASIAEKLLQRHRQNQAKNQQG